MGTDVYLSWNKKTEEQKKDQITGFDIDAGDKGYIRASIGMVEENELLRRIIPEKYWELSDEDYGKDGLLYDFSEENRNKLEQFAKGYIVRNITGIEIIESEGTKGQLEMGEQVVNILQKKGFDSNHIQTSNSREFRYAIMWLNSVFAFFDLGAELQREGLEPKIRISW